MAADLRSLTGVRSWLVESMLAYLAMVRREEVALPAYFPRRLQDDPGAMDAIFQRLRLQSRPEPQAAAFPRRLRDDPGAMDAIFQRLQLRSCSEPQAALDWHEWADPGTPAEYAPRRRGEIDEDQGPSVIAWDEETAARFPRAIILGDPGAGKTWLLRRIARHLAERAWHDLGERLVGLDTLEWPIRVRLPELGRTNDPIETQLTDIVCEKARLWLALQPAPRTREVSPRTGEVSPRLPDFVVDAVRTGRVVLLLDAWDEVAAPRRADLAERLRGFARKYPRARIVVTSRDVAQVDRTILAPPPGMGDLPAELELLAFGSEQVRDFCEAWFAPPAAHGRAQALRDVMALHPPMGELARNPLMLTFMCRLAEEPDAIPTRRVELYHRVVRGLLCEWQHDDEKPVSDAGLPRTDVYLAQHLELLGPVARALAEGGQFGEVNELDLRAIVKACHARLLDRDPRHELKDESAASLIGGWERDGLLMPTGGGQVAFLHRTFQEYLCGVALVPPELVDPTSLDSARAAAAEACAAALAARLTDGAWREVIRLALGHVGIIRHRPADATAIIGRVIRLAPGQPGEALAAMAAAVAEVSSDPRTGSRGTRRADGVTAACREEVVNAVWAAIENRWIPPGASRQADIDARQRAACGTALARLGDPRFLADAWFLPDDPLVGFRWIPPGPFTMGSDKIKDPSAEASELPAHSVELRGFYIARFPVTVAQFRAYVEDAGVTPGDPDGVRGVPNHPVVDVSWHEALAYCAWLTRKMRGWPGTPEELKRVLTPSAEGGPAWCVVLPSEAEWEKAARGSDGRIYPSGNTADPNKANYQFTGIDGTSAVGCFPGGTSPYGAEDMSGNVWEWTRSLLGKDFRAPTFKYPYDPADRRREDLRASNEEFRVVRGGAVYRLNWLMPAAARGRRRPDDRDGDLGFRVVVSPFFSDL